MNKVLAIAEHYIKQDMRLAQKLNELSAFLQLSHAEFELAQEKEKKEAQEQIVIWKRERALLKEQEKAAQMKTQYDTKKSDIKVKKEEPARTKPYDSLRAAVLHEALKNMHDKIKDLKYWQSLTDAGKQALAESILATIDRKFLMDRDAHFMRTELDDLSAYLNVFKKYGYGALSKEERARVDERIGEVRGRLQVNNNVLDNILAAEEAIQDS